MINVAGIPLGEPLELSHAAELSVPGGFGVDAIAKAVFTGRVSRASGKFVAEGVMEARIGAPCALCLRHVEQIVACPVREVFARERDDIDEWPVQDSALDLAPALLANLLTALPGRIVCSDDCKGLCPSCGADLNNNGCDCASDNEPARGLQPPEGSNSNGSDLSQR